MKANDPWEVIEYEVKMFNATHKILFSRSYYDRIPYSLKNAVEESAVLHTRILCEIILCRQSPHPNDILLSKANVFIDWSADKYQNIKAMIAKLNKKYDKRTTPGSPCQIFNTVMMHPTSERGREFNYRPILNDLYPLIQDIIAEIERLRGKPFARRFLGPVYPPTLFWS